MKSFGAALFICLLVSPVGLSAVSEAAPAADPPVQVSPPTTEPSLQALIADLSNESFSLREAATKNLWKLGDLALDELRIAAAGVDPEASHRAKQLLHKIELHITADTDPSIIALVERYQKATPAEKPKLLSEMQGKRAYHQMLKLYAAETDEKLRASLQNAVSVIAVLAARKLLIEDRAAEAEAILKLAPVDAKSLMARAAFHRANGTLEDELQRAKASKAKGSLAWQLALQRAAGRLDEAQSAAVDAREPLIAATMAMLTGDPVPWLEHHKVSRDSSSVTDLYSPLAIKRWQGKPLIKTDLEPTVKLLNSRNAPVRLRALNSLFLLGEPAAAESAFTKLSPLDAFAYFEALERIPEALAAIGLDPDQPDYATWAASHFERVLAQKPDAGSEATNELVAIASFLESRGLHEELAQAFDKPLADLATKDRDLFTSFLGELFGKRVIRTGITGPLMQAGTKWAADDEDRWEELITAAFGDNEEILACWKWLAELKPDSTRKQRLSAMFSLCGNGADPDHQRDSWLALAWTAVNKADAEKRPALLKHLALLIGQTGDVANSLKIRDLSPPDENAEEFDGLHLLELSAAERWEDASQILLKLLSNKDGRDLNTRPDLHAYAASCLRRAGHPEAAAKHDALVEKLALGDASLYLRIGHGYAFGTDYERCSLWWERAAREADPNNGYHPGILTVLATDFLKRGIWKQAAATSEVLAQFYSGNGMARSSPLSLLRMRLQADQARAFSLLENDRPKALGILQNCLLLLPCDGSLADHFFPALRKAGLIQQHDAWFETTWQHIQGVIRIYPKSHNTRNTAAWLASRSLLHLDEAETHVKLALATHPNQSAYLDTMAELQFARGNRKQAIKWSDKAINYMPGDDDIRRQHQHFSNDPLPK